MLLSDGYVFQNESDEFSFNSFQIKSALSNTSAF